MKFEKFISMLFKQYYIVKKAIRHIKIITTFVQFYLKIIHIKLNNYKSISYEVQNRNSLGKPKKKGNIYASI